MRIPASLTVCLMVLASAAAESAEIIGKAGSAELDAVQVRALIAALPDASRKAVAKDAGALEQVIRAELVSRALRAEARAAGFDRAAATVSELERVQVEALSRLWLLSQSQVPAGYPADADVAAAYEQNKSALTAPAEYRLAQIFVAAPDAADPAALAKALRKLTELAPKLAANADFGKLAREYSDQAETAGNGGVLGWLAEGKIMTEVRGAVAGLKPGEIAGPVKTAQGFHFVKLLELKPARQLLATEARDTLVAALRARRAQELQQQYLAALGERLSVSINQIALASLQSSLTQ